MTDETRSLSDVRIDDRGWGRYLDIPLACPRNRERYTIRLLMLGWGAGRIARKLKRSERQIRYVMAHPTFQRDFEALQRDYFRQLDQCTRRLLGKAIMSLDRDLSHRDPRIRMAAREQALRLHGKWIEKLDVTGNLGLDHTGQVQHDHRHAVGVIPPEQMTDEMRTHMRQLLALTRPTQPSAMLAKVNGHAQETTDESR